MSSEGLAGLVMATGLWVIAAAALFTAPTKPPSEIWVSTASEKVRSHPTLVRAGDPIITGSIARKI